MQTLHTKQKHYVHATTVFKACNTSVTNRTKKSGNNQTRKIKQEKIIQHKHCNNYQKQYPQKQHKETMKQQIEKNENITNKSGNHIRKQPLNEKTKITATPTIQALRTKLKRILSDNH